MSPEPKLLAPMELAVPGQERSHVDDVKLDKKGRPRLYHHIIWGWIRPQTLYFLEKVHQFAPMASGTIDKFIEGGYRAKNALWSNSAEITVLGTSLTLPIGLMIPLIYSKAIADAYNAIQANPQDRDAWRNFFYWLYAFIGPWGDLLGIIGMGSYLFGQLGPGPGPGPGGLPPGTIGGGPSTLPPGPGNSCPTGYFYNPILNKCQAII